MSERKSRKPIWRSASLVILGLLLGMVMLTPATAHFTTNTRHLGKHAWQQFIKQKADKRYADNRLKYVRTDLVGVAANDFAFAEAVCPAGWYATGGGWATTGAGLVNEFSFPSDGSGGLSAGRTAWSVVAFDIGGFGGSFRAYVICAKVDKQNGNYMPGVSLTTPDLAEPDLADWRDILGL